MDPAGADVPPSGLARCVGDADRFLAETWSRAPHLQPATGLEAVLTLDDVDRLLADSALRLPAFRLVRHGVSLPAGSYTRRARVGSRQIADLIDPGRVYRLFEEGASIVLQGLHRYWPPVGRLCRDLELTLTHPVQANAYVTPSVAQGLDVHADGHDVFAVQTHGTKHWVVYEPVPHLGAGLVPEGQRGAPVLDLTLVPGDCLYVPKGTPHAARTVDSASIHLTVGVRLSTWREALAGVVNGLLDDDPLPPGFAHDLQALTAEARQRLRRLADALAGADPALAAAQPVRRFWRGRAPLLSGQLGQLLALDEIDDDTPVRRRPGATCHLVAGAELLTVVLGDRDLHLPAAAEPALRRLCEQPALRVGDLADLVDASSRLVLVRRLVREGLLLAVRD